MAFPTEKQFKSWWKGRDDIYYFPRRSSCPLARYLRLHGYPKATVDSKAWYTTPFVRPLPAWAQVAVAEFDEGYSEGIKGVD